MPRHMEQPDVLQSGERCASRSEEHTSELQSPDHIVCRLLLEKKNSHLFGAGRNRETRTLRRLAGEAAVSRATHAPSGEPQLMGAESDRLEAVIMARSEAPFA